MRAHSVCFVVVSSIVAIVAGQDQKPLTVDDLVAKNIEAKGGAEALHALQTLRLTGKIVANEGKLQFGYVEIKKRADKVREEATLQGLTQIQAYDGKEGWQISPFSGRKDPERMSADDVKPLQEDAEIDGALVDWKEKESTVEYAGREDVEGTLAYKLKVIRKNGDVNLVYLDPDHFLEIRIVSQRIRHGSQEETETDVGDYEKVGGVFIPFAMETGRKGDPDKQKTIFDKGEANVPVDDAMFRFPAPPAK